jgi:hypothetical protein
MKVTIEIPRSLYRSVVTYAGKKKASKAICEFIERGLPADDGITGGPDIGTIKRVLHETAENTAMNSEGLERVWDHIVAFEKRERMTVDDLDRLETRIQALEAAIIHHDGHKEVRS